MATGARLRLQRQVKDSQLQQAMNAQLQEARRATRGLQMDH